MSSSKLGELVAEYRGWYEENVPRRMRWPLEPPSADELYYEMLVEKLDMEKLLHWLEDFQMRWNRQQEKEHAEGCIQQEKDVHDEGSREAEGQEG